MPREGRTDKAKRLLAEGRVVVTHANADEIRAVVRGDTGTYHRVTHRGRLWRCTCAARGDRCSHVAAVRQVTAPEGLPA